MIDDQEIGRLRIPPNSIQAEQSLLGAILNDNEAFTKVCDLVADTSFYRRENQLVYAAVSALVQRSKPADVITVFERLRGLGQADDCGGLKYLNALASSVPGASNARRYAEIVAEKAVLRAVIAIADEAATAAFNPGEKTVSGILGELGDKLSKLERTGQRVEPASFRALAVRAIDRYTEIASGRLKVGIPTGLPALDNLIGGLKDGRVYVVAARPSVGKSSAARSIALACAKAGNPTLVLSQEMPQDEVTDCLISQLARVDNERLALGGMQDEDWSRVAEAVDTYNEIPLLIDEQGGLTIHDIYSKARGVRGLKVLVIDYLQLCSTTLKGKTTNDEIGEVTKGLKRLALALHIPIVVLSQLNRKSEERVDKEPQLSELRDSGNIEQDVDVAILLWTVEENDEEGWRTVGWKVAKNRGGRKGRFAQRFVPSVYQWYESSFPEKKRGSL